MLSRSLMTRQTANKGGISISAAALASASQRLATSGAASSPAVGGSSSSAGTAPTPSTSKADRIASATATVDRLMNKAGGGGGSFGGGGGGLDLGLDFGKMDFKKIAEDTQQAITKERFGVRLPNTSSNGGGDAAASDPSHRFSSSRGRGGARGRGFSADPSGGAAFDGADATGASSSSSFVADPYYRAPNPNRPGSVMDKLRDYKLASDWEGALGYFTTAVGNPNEYRRWHVQHVRMLIDLLAFHGKMTEMWKVWRLARATNKFDDVNEAAANNFIFRLGRLSMLNAVVDDAQLAEWWVLMARDCLKLLESNNFPLDPKNEQTIKCALGDGTPQEVIRRTLDEINAGRAEIIAAKEAHGGGDVRRAARNSYQRDVSERAAGGGGGGYRGRGGGAGRGGRGGRPFVQAAEDAVTVTAASPDEPPADPTNTLELNQCLTYAKSTGEVEHFLSIALERQIEFNDDTYAKRIQRLGLRRREAFRKQKEGWSGVVGTQGTDDVHGEIGDALNAAAVDSSAGESGATAGSSSSSSSSSPAAAHFQRRAPREHHPDRSAEHAPLDTEILAEAKRLFHEANVYANRSKHIRLFDPSLDAEACAAMAPEELLGMHVKADAPSTSSGNNDANGGDENENAGNSVASSSSSLPSTSLCNALLYELRRANAFDDLRLVEAMMRGPEALTPQQGRYWRISPSSKTVDQLVSCYFRSGYTERCKELFDEMKVNYAARLSPLVYTTMIKIQSAETAPTRDADTGALRFPKRAVPQGVTPRMASIAAHQELNQLIHQLAADGADRRLNDSANIALINKWAQTRRRK